MTVKKKKEKIQSRQVSNDNREIEERKWTIRKWIAVNLQLERSFVRWTSEPKW